VIAAYLLSQWDITYLNIAENKVSGRIMRKFITANM
jgi:hypothetical protein